MKKLLIPVAIAALSAPAIADDYRFEAGVGYIKNELNSETENQSYGVTGAFYLAPVDDSVGPKREAAFLGQASDVHVGYARSNLKVEPKVDPGFGSFDEDGDTYALGGRYVSLGGVILEADYAQTSIDDIDAKAYGVGVGYYLSDTSALGLAYSRIDGDDSGIEDDLWTLGYKQLFNNQFDLEVDLDYSKPKYGKEAYGVNGDVDYYLNENFSIGGQIGYVSSDSDFRKGWDYGVKAEYFINSMFAVNAGYSQFKPEDGDEPKVWSIGLTGRF